MTTVTVKGYEFHAVLVRDAFGRRAVQFKNNILAALSKIGIASDDVIVDLESQAIKNIPASATWYADGYRMYYCYKSAKRYIDNLFVVCKVIELAVEDVLAEKKSFDEFLFEFTEKDDVEETRKEAREVLCIEEDELDMDTIDKKYKELAKKYHPDVSSGDAEMFKKINLAHKILKRELR